MASVTTIAFDPLTTASDFNPPALTTSSPSTSTITNTATTFPSPLSPPSTAFTSPPPYSGGAAAASPTTTASPAANSFGGSENYFFGFLITFVVLLVIFLGCGCLSRRRFLRRRRSMLEQRIAGLREGERKSWPVEPTFVEPWLAKSPEANWDWRSIKPLATVVMRHDHEENARFITPAPPTPHFLSMFSINSLMIPRFRRNQTSKTLPDAEKARAEVTKPPDPIDLQVAVMIVMPRNPDEGEGKAEYEFGLSEVSYVGGKV